MALFIITLIIALLFLGISFIFAYYALSAVIFAAIGGGWIATERMFYSAGVKLFLSIFLPIIAFPLFAYYFVNEINSLPFEYSGTKDLVYWVISLLPIILYAIPVIFLFYHWVIKSNSDN